MPSRSWLTSPRAVPVADVEPAARRPPGEREAGPGEPAAEDGGAGPAGFGEFGAALVGEVVTPAFVRRRLNLVLRELIRSSALPPELAAEITAAGVREVSLVSDDGRERCFAAVVGLDLAADVGPRLLALGADARVTVRLTVRLRAFRPAVVGVDIDPITPRDVRIRVRTRTDWLPFSLDGGRFGPSRSAERAVPRLCELVNGQLDAAVDRRRLDLSRLLWTVVGRESGPNDGPNDGPDDGSDDGARPRGEQSIGFAELGEALLADTVDARLVAAAVAARTAEPLPVRFDDPLPVAGVVTLRPADVAELPGPPRERWFRLSVLADADLRVGVPARAVTGTLRAELILRVSTALSPATVHIRFEPVTRLQVVRARRELSGRMLAVPWPDQVLRSVRRRILVEVDQWLRQAGTRVAVAELVDSN